MSSHRAELYGILVILRFVHDQELSMHITTGSLQIKHQYPVEIMTSYGPFLI